MSMPVCQENFCLLEEVAAVSLLWDIVCQLLFWTKKKSLLVLIHGCRDIYSDLKSMELFPREGFLRRACFITGLLPHEGWSLITN